MRLPNASSLRSAIVPCAALLVALLVLVPTTAIADWLVTVGGERIETDGPWQVDGDQVRFTTAEGTAETLPAAEVDVGASQEASEAKITLYMTSWCPYCRKAQALLDELGAAYIARDIEEDREAMAEFRAKGKGSGGIPLIDFDGEVLRGFHAERIRQLASEVEGGVR